jgi:hypothetical protein
MAYINKEIPRYEIRLAWLMWAVTDLPQRRPGFAHASEKMDWDAQNGTEIGFFPSFFGSVNIVLSEPHTHMYIMRGMKKMPVSGLRY